MTDDPFAGYRPALLAELHRQVKGESLQHHAVLLQHLSPLVKNESTERDLMPALLCLLAAEALGGRVEDALPAATSLALLANMAAVFEGIAEAGRPGADGALLQSWGMPRALNAGDAFFALAQASAVETKAGSLLQADRRLQLLRVMDEVSQLLSETLYSRSATWNGEARPGGLFSAAMALGAICAGSDEATAEAITRFGDTLDAGEPAASLLQGLSEAARSRLIEAAKYIAEVKS
jgi:geranylgeranyl pyrophosphate synthase